MKFNDWAMAVLVFGLLLLVAFGYFFYLQWYMNRYVLYLCMQSPMTCEKSMYEVKTPSGVEHFEEPPYSELAWCQADAAKLSKAAPDKDGRYYVENNKWYECRAAKAKQQ